ncbi:MAG TPA: FemAB family PEP-CTERM system-associated protein [Oligoflexia bacterium]|nr:FemAB family PEP-CTERM system-associated protein [Oligoflexia bacterium]HMP48364.1 FemAB family PEP-CTERM system-associated protein [Oligoflexia bacterium]
MKIIIKNASDEDGPRWQNFLSKVPGAHPANDWRWRSVLRKTFNHHPLYLIAEDESGNIKGVLPLFLVKSLIFGSALISVPYLNGGGVVVSSDHSFEKLEIDDVWRSLLEAATGLIKSPDNSSNGVSARYIELRCREKLDHLNALSNFEERSHKVAMILSLNLEPESLFSSFPPKLRSQIRKPTKEGCIAESYLGNEVSSQQINDFYSVFSQNMKSLGTPVYSKKLFWRTLNAFRDKSRLTIVRYKDEPIAAGITVGLNNVVEIPWASSLRKYSKIAPNMLLYWEIIKQSCQDGYSFFDFGRSSVGAGTFKFKEQWGSVPVPLYWYYQVFDGEMPDISPQNNSFSLAVKIWKKLPLSLTKILGSYLTRSLP